MTKIKSNVVFQRIKYEYLSMIFLSKSLHDHVNEPYYNGSRLHIRLRRLYQEQFFTGDLEPHNEP
jgi:hypothetical protein